MTLHSVKPKAPSLHERSARRATVSSLGFHRSRLAQITRVAADRDQAITEGYRSGAYTLTEIARHFGIHQSTASRIPRRDDY